MLFRTIFLACVLTVYGEYLNNTHSQCPNIRTELKHIRKRRHLVFPDGSVASITISFAKAFHTHAPSGWMMTSDLDALFPLPDSTVINAHFRRKLHHRQKRELWERIINTLSLKNFNGHECMLRSICEAKKHLAPPGRSLVYDLLRAIFTAPLHDPDFVEEIGSTYDELLEQNVCARVHDCPFSILQFILDFNKQNKEQP